MGLSDPLITFRRVPEHAGIERQALEAFAEVLRKRVAVQRPFHCLITGDTELRRLNREFLGHDYATDVLSFPSAGGGDLAISRHRAAAQARSFGHSVTTEIELLMLHGVLHLAGYDHETDNGEMARTEQRWRAKLGLPTGVIERVHERVRVRQRA
jgi:probable rRNA maturation factor